MANIQNELDKIRSTQYGGEVRVAVHDGLKKVNEDIEAMNTAAASDAGKALKAKTVENGKVKEWEFGETAVIDDTLSNEGEAADAKATGDAIDDIKSAFDETLDLLEAVRDALIDEDPEEAINLIDTFLIDHGRIA